MPSGWQTMARRGVEEDVENTRRGVLYSSRRIGLKGLFDGLEAGCVEPEHGRRRVGYNIALESTNVAKVPTIGRPLFARRRLLVGHWR